MSGIYVVMMFLAFQVNMENAELSILMNPTVIYRQSNIKSDLLTLSGDCCLQSHITASIRCTPAGETALSKYSLY